MYKIIFRDMTEQRKMQDQLKKAKVELEATHCRTDYGTHGSKYSSQGFNEPP